MTTTVTLTGTGVPHPSIGRAGAGTLVTCDDIALQFDAGRSTTLRLLEAGTSPLHLTAVFLTHVHSDHIVDLADMAMTRWIQQLLEPTGPLTIVCPEGMAARFVERMFEPYADDIALRIDHVQEGPPEVDRRTFAVPMTPVCVWSSADGRVHVDAVAVHHEPVREAVAYRVRTPDATIVISGDTRVCDEVADLAAGADVLVHEACRQRALANSIAGTDFETIFNYHSDTVALGALAERARVGHLMLTHLIPQPTTPAQEAGFEADVRAGGYTGPVTVGRDLMSVRFPAD